MNHTTHNNRWRRWALWVMAALLGAALAFWAFQPRPLLVEVAPVTVGRFEQAIEEDGQLRLKHRYLISAPTQAELARPTLKVGDAVRVSGPLGSAYLRRKHEGPMLCVAGGTGLAPILSILLILSKNQARSGRLRRGYPSRGLSVFR